MIPNDSFKNALLLPTQDFETDIRPVVIHFEYAFQELLGVCGAKMPEFRELLRRSIFLAPINKNLLRMQYLAVAKDIRARIE
jgi:hypothetical protein